MRSTVDDRPKWDGKEVDPLYKSVKRRWLRNGLEESGTIQAGWLCNTVQSNLRLGITSGKQDRDAESRHGVSMPDAIDLTVVHLEVSRREREVAVAQRLMSEVIREVLVVQESAFAGAVCELLVQVE